MPALPLGFRERKKQHDLQLHSSMNGSTNELYGWCEVKWQNPCIMSVPDITLTSSGDVALDNLPRSTVQIIY